MNNEKVYQFNEYVLGYDKGHNDRSCLTISKIQNDNMYVMSSLYDGNADIISLMLDSLQKENKNLQQQLDKYKLILKALHKHFTEHEEYENNEFLRQLENCAENDMIWLKRMAGDDDNG